jgi:L-ascorbate metabolism protein UlaG (beta-lactamase superfamily)
MKFNYAGRTILADPMLSKKGEIMTFAGIEPNPTVDLPVPAPEIVQGIEHVLLTHAHPDHYDPAAVALIPKDIGFYC